jgi:hypothetical protein
VLRDLLASHQPQPHSTHTFHLPDRVGPQIRSICLQDNNVFLNTFLASNNMTVHVVLTANFSNVRAHVRVCSTHLPQCYDMRMRVEQCSATPYHTNPHVSHEYALQQLHNTPSASELINGRVWGAQISFFDDAEPLGNAVRPRYASHTSTDSNINVGAATATLQHLHPHRTCRLQLCVKCNTIHLV